MIDLGKKGCHKTDHIHYCGNIALGIKITFLATVSRLVSLAKQSETRVRNNG